MIRVFWWNGGAWSEDVPEPEAMNRIKYLTSMGYLCWWKRLDDKTPPPIPFQAA